MKGIQRDTLTPGNMCIALYLYISKSCSAMSEPPKDGEESEKSNIWRQYVAGFAGSLLALSCGTMLAWTSPVLPLLAQFGARPTLDEQQASWVGSLLTVGAFAGSLPAGLLADHFGRKKLLLLAALPLYISWCILLWAFTASGLYVGRILGGFTIGLVSVATPTYINEIAERRIRGTLGTFFQLQLTLGVLLMYILALFGDVFRMTWACSLIPLLFFGLFVWMPESPEWLMSRGRTQEARAALQWLRGQGVLVDAELAEMSKGGERTTAGGLGSLWRNFPARRGMLLSLGLMFFQQMTGVNAVIFYTKKIYQMSGTSLDPYLASLITAVVQVVATLVSTVLVDMSGRKVLLLISASVITLCLAALGTYIYLLDMGKALTSLSLLPVLSICLYSFVFNMGLGPIPWLMMAELIRPELRAAAAAVTAATSWGLAFLVTKFFSDLTGLIGVGPTFMMFGACTLVCVVFVIGFLPETKGRDANTIESKLGAMRT